MMKERRNSRLYQIWADMKDRCYNTNNRFFNSYGGRGIIVCDGWKDSFSKFEKWSNENGYLKSLTLDRANNNKGYSPDNCRWATKSIQAQNTVKLCKRNVSGYRGVSLTREVYIWYKFQ